MAFVRSSEGIALLPRLKKASVHLSKVVELSDKIENATKVARSERWVSVHDQASSKCVRC